MKHLIFLAVFILILMIKNVVTFFNMTTILNAIQRYKESDIVDKISVSYNDMISYDKALLRLWDWTYKRLLPTDKYEVIKPYIKKKRC